jgi:hypothetical protein
VALAAVIVVFCGRVTWGAPSTAHDQPLLVQELGAVLPATLSAIDNSVNSATGRTGTYLVTWDSTAGWGLLNELERRGYHAGASRALEVTVTAHRVLDEAEATARIEVASGVWIDRWRALPDATEVAFVDPRTPAQQTRYNELRASVIATLRANGLSAAADKVAGDNFLGAVTDAGIAGDPLMRLQIRELGNTAQPLAVFISPVGVDP